MAAKRLSMRKLKEVLRLAALGHSDRVIAHSLDIGRSTVQRYRKRAEDVELSWPVDTPAKSISILPPCRTMVYGADPA